MKIITDNAVLMAHVPNAIAAVRGETTLFEKIAVHLQAAEDWVCETFCSDRTFNTITGYASNNPIKTITAQLIVAEALRNAIPALDLVYTPNGFAVVQTNNLTPASKSRVDRLIEQTVTLRDACISKLLPLLVGASQWLRSACAVFFSQSLFHDLSLVDQLGQTKLYKWEKYIELLPQVVEIEASLSEEWLSPELMAVLRDRNLQGTLTAEQAAVVRNVKPQLLAVLRGESISGRRMQDIVNYIRQRPYSFPEWHNSDTAKLFSPPVFQNSKKSGGYFF